MGMMKKISIALVALVFSATVAAEGKVVVFNMQAAIIQTDAAKKSLQALDADAEFSQMKAKFEGLRSDLMSLDKNAKTNAMTWSNEQTVAHRKKVEYKSADLKLAAEKLKAERNAVVKKIMQELGPKAKAALNEVVTAEGLGLVLDSSVAYWANASYDITAKVTAKLNK